MIEKMKVFNEIDGAEVEIAELNEISSIQIGNLSISVVSNDEIHIKPIKKNQGNMLILPFMASTKSAPLIDGVTRIHIIPPK